MMGTPTTRRYRLSEGEEEAEEEEEEAEAEPALPPPGPPAPRPFLTAAAKGLSSKKVMETSAPLPMLASHGGKAGSTKRTGSACCCCEVEVEVVRVRVVVRSTRRRPVAA
jgi:hypothetical protein